MNKRIGEEGYIGRYRIDGMICIGEGKYVSKNRSLIGRRRTKQVLVS